MDCGSNGGRGLSQQDIVLASSSPRRTQLLQQIGICHRVMPIDVDETYPAELSPQDAVQLLAGRKAEAAVAHGAEGWVIGADTIVAGDGASFGKPRDAADAHAMLRRLQGRRHDVYSGVMVQDTSTGARRCGYSHVTVWMRSVADEEIAWYVASGEPLDKAGAYSIQGVGALFVERLYGDYYAVVGLPLQQTAGFLRDLGWSRDQVTCDGPNQARMRGV